MLAERSPIPRIRSLAKIVRLRLDDWAAYDDEANELRYSQDAAIRAEAVLA